MSQATASIPSTRPLRRGAPAGRPRLVALPRPEAKTRPRLLYAAIAVAAVTAIVATQLLLSIGVSGDAFRLASLQREQQSLGRSYQQVSETVQEVSSPQNLAANAQALGMVEDSSPVYLELGTGQVIGSPTPASASAGTTGNQDIANALIQDLPLVNGKPRPGSTAAKDAAAKKTSSDSATTAGARSGAGTSPVPWTGALPAPSTH